LGKYDDAVDPLVSSVRLKSDVAKAYDELGYSYRKLGRNDAAKDAFAQSIRLGPESEVPHFGLADLYFYNLRQYPEAIEEYRSGLRFNAGNSGALRNLGAAYNALTRYAEALEPLAAAIKLRPDDATAYETLGIAYEGMGRANDAIVAYTEATRLNPRSTSVHVNLGRVYAKQGNSAAAQAEYQLLLSLDSESAKRLLELIKP
jgi:tetratricopeptide (TPR) repeat protein